MTREEAKKNLVAYMYYAFDDLPEDVGRAIDMAIKALEQEQCEDAVSRKAAVVQLHHNKTGDDDIDVIIEKDIATIQTLPPVIPKQKAGKWKLVQRGKSVDLCCDNCGAVRIEEIAYNYTIDELNKFFKEDFKEYLKHPDMSYCPCCGTKMEDRNDKNSMRYLW